MTISKKHFEAIAKTLESVDRMGKAGVHGIEQRIGHSEACEQMAWHLADTLAQFNDRFDKMKFINACKGVKLVKPKGK